MAVTAGITGPTGTQTEPYSVKVVFAQAVTNFDLMDISVTNGAPSALSSSDGGTTWTFTVTPNDDATGSNTIDLTGQVNVAGQSQPQDITVGSITVSFDTEEIATDITATFEVPTNSMDVPLGYMPFQPQGTSAAHLDQPGVRADGNYVHINVRIIFSEAITGTGDLALRTDDLTIDNNDVEVQSVTLVLGMTYVIRLRIRHELSGNFEITLPANSVAAASDSKSQNAEAKSGVMYFDTDYPTITWSGVPSTILSSKDFTFELTLSSDRPIGAPRYAPNQIRIVTTPAGGSGAFELHEDHPSGISKSHTYNVRVRDNRLITRQTTSVIFSIPANELWYYGAREYPEAKLDTSAIPVVNAIFTVPKGVDYGNTFNFSVDFTTTVSGVTISDFENTSQSSQVKTITHSSGSVWNGTATAPLAGSFTYTFLRLKTNSVNVGDATFPPINIDSDRIIIVPTANFSVPSQVERGQEFSSTLTFQRGVHHLTESDFFTGSGFATVLEEEGHTTTYTLRSRAPTSGSSCVIRIRHGAVETLDNMITAPSFHTSSPSITLIAATVDPVITEIPPIVLNPGETRTFALDTYITGDITNDGVTIDRSPPSWVTLGTGTQQNRTLTIAPPANLAVTGMFDEYSFRLNAKGSGGKTDSILVYVFVLGEEEVLDINAWNIPNTTITSARSFITVVFSEDITGVPSVRSSNANVSVGTVTEIAGVLNIPVNVADNTKGFFWLTIGKETVTATNDSNLKGPPFGRYSPTIEFDRTEEEVDETLELTAWTAPTTTITTETATVRAHFSEDITGLPSVGASNRNVTIGTLTESRGVVTIPLTIADNTSGVFTILLGRNSVKASRDNNIIGPPGVRNSPAIEFDRTEDDETLDIVSWNIPGNTITGATASITARFSEDIRAIPSVGSSNTDVKVGTVTESAGTITIPLRITDGKEGTFYLSIGQESVTATSDVNLKGPPYERYSPTIDFDRTTPAEEVAFVTISYPERPVGRYADLPLTQNTFYDITWSEDFAGFNAPAHIAVYESDHAGYNPLTAALTNVGTAGTFTHWRLTYTPRANTSGEVIISVLPNVFKNNIETFSPSARYDTTTPEPEDNPPYATWRNIPVSITQANTDTDVDLMFDQDITNLAVTDIAEEGVTNRQLTLYTVSDTGVEALHTGNSPHAHFRVKVKINARQRGNLTLRLTMDSVLGEDGTSLGPPADVRTPSIPYDTYPEEVTPAIVTISYPERPVGTFAPLPMKQSVTYDITWSEDFETFNAGSHIAVNQTGSGPFNPLPMALTNVGTSGTFTHWRLTYTPPANSKGEVIISVLAGVFKNNEERFSPTATFDTTTPPAPIEIPTIPAVVLILPAERPIGTLSDLPIPNSTDFWWEIVWSHAPGSAFTAATSIELWDSANAGGANPLNANLAGIADTNGLRYRLKHTTPASGSGEIYIRVVADVFQDNPASRSPLVSYGPAPMVEVEEPATVTISYPERPVGTFANLPFSQPVTYDITWSEDFENFNAGAHIAVYQTGSGPSNPLPALLANVGTTGTFTNWRFTYTPPTNLEGEVIIAVLAGVFKNNVEVRSPVAQFDTTVDTPALTFTSGNEIVVRSGETITFSIVTNVVSNIAIVGTPPAGVTLSGRTLTVVGQDVMDTTRTEVNLRATLPNYAPDTQTITIWTLPVTAVVNRIDIVDVDFDKHRYNPGEVATALIELSQEVPATGDNAPELTDFDLSFGTATAVELVDAMGDTVSTGMSKYVKLTIETTTMDTGVIQVRFAH